MDIDSLYSDKKKYFIFDVKAESSQCVYTRIVDISTIKNITLKKTNNIGGIQFELTFEDPNHNYNFYNKDCIFNILNYFVKHSNCIDPSTVKSIQSFMNYYNRNK